MAVAKREPQLMVSRGQPPVAIPIRPAAVPVEVGLVIALDLRLFLAAMATMAA